MKAIMAIVAAFALAGCDYHCGNGLRETAYGLFIHTMEIKGHEYIIYKEGNGCCIIHSHSCACMKVKEEAK